MANRLKMAQIQAVTALLQRGWSQRRVARELGLDRETVARYARLRAQLAAKPATLRPGSEAVGEAKPATLRPGSEPGSEAVREAGEGGGEAPDPLLAGLAHGALLASNGAAGATEPGQHSACWPHRDLIQRKLDQALSAQRIWQDLKSEHGFTASYYSVLRFVAKLRPAEELPFRRLECAAGAEAQVDFGSGAVIVGPDGKRQRTHVFRIVLSHSRKAYSEAVTRQTTDAFLSCLENAFHHFGGVPRTLVIDNLKAAVTKADWFDPELNPKMIAFCEHYGTVLLPTRPYTPRHKGKVERGIDYVQENALKGHSFASLHEQNRHLLEWEGSVADTRIHGTTRRHVGVVFTQAERPALLPLPAARFANFREARRTVHRDGHVEIERAYYSTPPEHVGRTVWVRWDNRLVRVFNERFELLATHVRRGVGGFSTLEEHVHRFKRSKVEWGAQQLLAQADCLAPAIGAWAKAMHEARGVQGIRPLLGLLGLPKKFPLRILEDACAAAQRHGAFRLRDLRRLAERRLEEDQEMPLLAQHELIRPLAEYGQIARQVVAPVVTVTAWDAALGAGEPEAPVSPAPKPPPPPSLSPFRGSTAEATPSAETTSPPTNPLSSAPKPPTSDTPLSPTSDHRLLTTDH